MSDIKDFENLSSELFFKTIQKIRKILPEFDVPVLCYFDKGQTSGYARIYRDKGLRPEVHLNKSIPTRKDLEDTVIHELAHHLDFQLHGKLSHGRWWKFFVSELGGDSSPTTTMVLPYQRNVKRLAAYCDCGLEHRITSRKWNAINDGKSRYICAACKTRIRLQP